AERLAHAHAQVVDRRLEGARALRAGDEAVDVVARLDEDRARRAGAAIGHDHRFQDPLRAHAHLQESQVEGRWSKVEDPSGGWEATRVARQHRRLRLVTFDLRPSAFDLISGTAPR